MNHWNLFFWVVRGEPITERRFRSHDIPSFGRDGLITLLYLSYLHLCLYVY